MYHVLSMCSGTAHEGPLRRRSMVKGEQVDDAGMHEGLVPAAGGNRLGSGGGPIKVVRVESSQPREGDYRRTLGCYVAVAPSGLALM